MSDNRLDELLLEVRSAVVSETIADSYFDVNESTHFFMRYEELCDEIRELFNER